MATMLKDKETGEVYPYNVNLARHERMESFEKVDPQFAEAAKSNKTIGDVVEKSKPVNDLLAAAPKKKQRRKQTANVSESLSVGSTE